MSTELSRQVPAATIPFEDLLAAARTLQAVVGNYRAPSHGWEMLMEAQRLLAVEVRAQYGMDAWGRFYDATHKPQAP